MVEAIRGLTNRRGFYLSEDWWAHTQNCVMFRFVCGEFAPKGGTKQMDLNKRLIAYLLFVTTLALSACASVQSMPQTADQVVWDAAIGDTGWAEWQEELVIEDTNSEEMFRSARIALGESSFSFERGSAATGTAIGQRGMTAHDWNVIAGVYFRPLADNEGDFQVRILVEGSKDIGFSGDATSAPWAQMIANSLYRQFAAPPSSEAAMRPEGPATGSGFVVGDGTFVVTAYHVIEGRENISVIAADGGLQPAEISQVMPNEDVAILRVSQALPALTIRFDEIRLGEEVIALGYPLPELQGRDLTATSGEVNSVSGFRGDPRFFQLNAVIQPGNSGGPVVGADGRVVGIALSRLSDLHTLAATGSLPQNVNFAVKTSFLATHLPHSEAEAREMEDRVDLIDRVGQSVVLIEAR